MAETNEILDVLIRAAHTSGMATSCTAVTIRPLDGPRDAAAFRTLNEEWIVRHFALEDEDRRQLGDPVGAYVAPGGQVLMAHHDGRAVGCVAVVPVGAGAWEVSKMAVAPEHRGHGTGRRLLQAAIAWARERGATSLVLGSSTDLEPAVRLYESVGFAHVPPETLHMPYARATVWMRLALDA
ncbi:GNAT family N-acetyltransferase [Patulibacter sp. SYSU D01012]|uniref:GNAT family N-acetyltransferase n=1 Tax=Patulibacter sp. SYSU D01012 TaxID=2817381 RepID=UPI001B3038D9|nr:GNAT family N-acetyltransferase [Patulibacter sp. SYSU D01012]